MVFLWKTAFEKTRKNVVKYFLQTKEVLLYEENPGRLPAPAGHAAAYLAEMPALEVRTSRYLKQALLAQHYQELLQSHCVPDYLRLFKEISCKERQRKNSGKKLNLMDKDYYANAEKLLSEEFALALQTTPDAMREQLHTAALA